MKVSRRKRKAPKFGITLGLLKRIAAELNSPTTPAAGGDYWFFLHPDTDIPDEIRKHAVLIDRLPPFKEEPTK